jgi:hypothetical protein
MNSMNQLSPGKTGRHLCGVGWARELGITMLMVLFLGVWGAGTSHASLPWGTVFKGEDRFRSLLKEAYDKKWAALPIGERTAAVGLALCGTPYGNYTLEIHDKIEAPSVNFQQMDCWTFFEISLAFARMLGDPPKDHTPRRLLHYIELDRYRGGRCDGSYLSRLHFLEDWAHDNASRGWVKDVTREIGGVRMEKRNINTMSAPWRSYRYLRATPSLVSEVRQMEARVSSLPVYYIPKSRVPAAESKIRNGDIICITTSWKGCYSSHVGMAYRDKAGVLRFMHATSSRAKGRRVLVDARLSSYLGECSKRTGIFVVRPVK